MGFNAEQYAGSESKWLRADDLKGREVQVEIDTVNTVSFEEGDKLGLRFAGRDKGMVLNVTNTRRLIDGYGKDTDGWVGKSVVLYSEQVSFAGSMVNGLRLRIPRDVATDDDIPF